MRENLYGKRINVTYFIVTLDWALPLSIVERVFFCYLDFLYCDICVRNLVIFKKYLMIKISKWLRK